MASPRRPERNRAARSFRQLRRFHHVINSYKVFGTHKSGRPLLHHQMLKINHLLTLRSPNANDLEGIRLTMSAPATRTKSMPLSADLAFRSVARPAVRVTAVLRGAKKCSEKTT